MRRLVARRLLGNRDALRLHRVDNESRNLVAVKSPRTQPFKAVPVPHAAHGPFVVGRKNWLFCDSVKGAESSAIVYSLVETAKANGIEPYGYLLLVLSMLPYLGKSPTHEELEKLMPWHPAVRHREHIRK